jgi:hypothetical protein
MSPVTRTEAIPTTWNDDRDAAFFSITDTLAADGFDKVLADLLVAESWESMAKRSVARSQPHDRDLVPVPVAARRRAA